MRAVERLGSGFCRSSNAAEARGVGGIVGAGAGLRWLLRTVG